METKQTNEQPTEALWCMHIAGPDEIHACTSEAAAVARAKTFNEWANKYATEKGIDFIKDPATAQPWPTYFKREEHSEDLRRQADRKE